MSDTKRLLQVIIEVNLEEDALDDLVYDSAQEKTLSQLNATDDENEQDRIIKEAERWASTINNGGFESQVEFLLRFDSADLLEQLIRDLAS